MIWYWAIPFALGLTIVMAFLSAFTGINFVVIMIFVTAIWAAIDSRKLELRKYKSGIATGTFLLFIGVLLLWIVGFPWYLHIRHQIKNNMAELKEVDADTPSDPAGANGGDGEHQDA